MGWPRYGAAEDAEVCSRATRMFLSRDGLNWRELKGVTSVDCRIRSTYAKLNDFSMPMPIFFPSIEQAEITVKGDGMFDPIPDLLDLERFQLHLPSGSKLDGLLAIGQISQDCEARPSYSLRGNVIDHGIFKTSIS
jgi:hypothetical protein